MPVNEIPGGGKKRPLLDVEIGRLTLDPNNPRLPDEAVGQSEQKLIEVLYESFDVDELLHSMGQNGYFDEEPLVAFPSEPVSAVDLAAYSNPLHKDRQRLEDALAEPHRTFVVAEGNRRLTAAKILTDASLRQRLRLTNLSIDGAVASDLAVLPVIIYPTRSEVVPYLGVRHITGTRKWDSYAKARYIWNLLNSGGTVQEVERELGDRNRAIRQSAVAFSALNQAAVELDYDISLAKDNFSFLLLGLNQRPVRQYLGLPAASKVENVLSPIADDKLERLGELLRWMFGESNRSIPIIRESRDITNYLAPVLASEEATSALRSGRPLQDAYEYTNGEEQLVLRALARANRSVENALAVAHRHATDDVKAQVKKLASSVANLARTLEPSRD
ncbi:MAG: hypothetical protein H4O13_07620 [Xanthomonadales bacterium]|nr:hypothetical protein [Xanthomonadales bacterium]